MTEVAPKPFLTRHKQVMRYLISGGLAALVLFGSLILFREIFHVWYLQASAVAFLLSLLTSFSLQKFWTFEDTEKQGIHKQFGIFVVVSIGGLAFNLLAMYLFVEVLGVWYLLGQFITTAFIALFSFFIYRDMVFNRVV